MTDIMSGVGVVDKVAQVLGALAHGPLSLPELTAATRLPRATAHRLAVALAVHGLVARTSDGGFALGRRLIDLAAGLGAAGVDLVSAAGPVLARLRDSTGESAQLYVRRGDTRVCVAAADRPAGLRDSVPVGAVLPMSAGSGAQALLAYEPAADVERLLPDAAFSRATLATVRRRGWAESVAEREPGVVSVSAPVRDPQGVVVAAVCVSGPVDRLGRAPGRRLAPAVTRAAAGLERELAPG